ncbi:MAG: hypothetical protein HYS17_01780 [Micavibrio aeruginosavorus]|uniref:Uncharacterized protein n=1 Tax=Micavibrio aeruginosavorus TaxID=349221 RepID=A0A7T5UHM8_9BACT|nr:MAG: hypothetical protein HYS17_01780 [Micavibrio aeruginosavorus]
MSKKFGFLKSGLMGSSTMPMGTGGAPFNLFPVAGHRHHEHAADGSCCGHDHDHHHAHDGLCGHDHVHDENCGRTHK